MKTIRLGFYKHSESFFWRMIRWKQSLSYSNKYSQYSHVELIFDDWYSFSSSERDDWVRFKKIKFKKGYWDFIEIKVSTSKYNKMLTFCNKHKWDWYNFYES